MSELNNGKNDNLNVEANNVDQSKTIVLNKSLTSPEKQDTNGGEEKTPKSGTNLTEAERLEMRIKKFGAQSENAKLNIRAERFGLKSEATNGSASAIIDPTKLEKRAQRFGISAPNTPVNNSNSTISAEVLEKRAKRFGMANNVNSDSSASNNNSASDEILSKRKERFGIVDEDSKKKLRAERFANKV